MSDIDQNDETSSREKSKPPIGALNAVATPAAAPALMKLRLRKKKHAVYHLYISKIYNNLTYLPNYEIF